MFVLTSIVTDSVSVEFFFTILAGIHFVVNADAIDGTNKRMNIRLKSL